MKYRLILLAALSIPAAAQTVYKCTVDGKVSYTQTPCPAGAASASELAVPAAPAQDPAAAAELARQKKQAAALEKDRLKREAQQDRESERRADTARVHARKCAKLKLDQAAAEEEAKGVAIQNEARARARAKRAADNLALECPGR
jgi:hypothetical protein